MDLFKNGGEGFRLKDEVRGFCETGGDGFTGTCFHFGLKKAR